MPVTVLNYTSDNVARTLRQTLSAARFDVVQMESIHLFGYLDAIRQSKNPPAVILDWHNIESELMRRYSESTASPFKRLVAARTAGLLEKLEQRALRSFAAHTVVSEREKEKLFARNPGASIHVIPNGVDTAAFASSSAPAATERATLLFVGSMDYHANSDAVIWFCREIWPQLAAEFPMLNFEVVGRNPTAEVKALAGARIVITGTVEDVRPFYHRAFAVLVPLRVGGGTRLKILEAMAAGVPVISTRLGAEGLYAENQREILLADTPSDMAASIRALLNQPDLAPRLRAAASVLVSQHYDWSVLGKKLAAVYDSVRNQGLLL
jgi:glycosyltransferase involved in cell wall biosynthesis